MIFFFYSVHRCVLFTELYATAEVWAASTDSEQFLQFSWVSSGSCVKTLRTESERSHWSAKFLQEYVSKWFFLDSQTCHVRKNSPHPCSNAEFSFYKTMRCRQTFSAMNVAGPGHHTDSHFTRLCMWSVHSEHSHIPVPPMGCVQFHNSISLVIFSKRFLWMKSGCRGFRSNDLSRSHFLLFMSPTLAFQWWCVHLIFMAPH